jgi:MFS transporter, DHA1 family, multidrug resistance protein
MIAPASLRLLHGPMSKTDAAYRELISSMNKVPPAIPDTGPKKAGQLSDGMIVLLVAMIASFPALSTDLYLPALPTMSRQLNCSVSLVNLSLVVFFIFISISSLFWGPLSDKYGRKRILVTGVPLYIVSSVLCMVSRNVYQLIAARIFQAIGAGAAMAVTMAIVKDVFPGRRRERTFALVSMLNGVIPVIAPLIGAYIIKLTSWRGTFGVLTIIGMLVMAFILFLKETSSEKSDLSVFQSTARLLVVLKNQNLSKLILTFSVVSIPILGFISVSSFIFIQHFGVSEEAFGLYFGSISLLFIIGGPLYLFLQRFFKPLPIMTVCFFGSILSGLLTLTIRQTGPILFAVSVGCGYLSVAVSRPPASSLLMEQQDKDTGAASSLIQASFLLTGSMGMLFLSYDWSNRIMVLGILNLVLGIAGLALWFHARKRCRMPKHFI